MFKVIRGRENIESAMTIVPPSSFDVARALPMYEGGYAVARYRHGEGWNIFHVDDVEQALQSCETLHTMCEKFPEVIGSWLEYSDTVIFNSNISLYPHRRVEWYVAGIIIEE